MFDCGFNEILQECRRHPIIRVYKGKKFEASILFNLIKSQVTGVRYSAVFFVKDAKPWVRFRILVEHPTAVVGGAVIDRERDKVTIGLRLKRVEALK